MINSMKIGALYLSKWCGLFTIVSAQTRQSLRIICYHGISLFDEYRVHPGVFMRPETFRARMHYLREWKANVFRLEDGLKRLHSGTLPRRSVAITIDDGWYGTYEFMAPVLKQFNFPATLYSSTYYSQMQTFVPELFVPYVLFMSNTCKIPLYGLGAGLTGFADLSTPASRAEVGEILISYGNEHLNANEREKFCWRLAEGCGVAVEPLLLRRALKFMSVEELSAISAFGIDVQLHTHRHRFSQYDRLQAEEEIDLNRNVLSSLSNNSLEHFCFPSGEYAECHQEWLSRLGIKSAVTTDFGLAHGDTPIYFLPRICDSESMSQINFEAAVTGFKSFILKR